MNKEGKMKKQDLLCRSVAGKIFTFLADDTQENNPLILYHTFTVLGGESGFVYSCLTELEDGRIGMLWEPNHSTMYFDVFGIYDFLPESQSLQKLPFIWN